MRDRYGICRDAGRTDHDDEFIAARAGDGVDVAHHGAQAPRDLVEHLIARPMPERVVDELEAVEIDDQHRERLAVAVGMRHRLRQPVIEQHAVGQARQRIVRREVAQLPVRRFQLLRARGHDLLQRLDLHVQARSCCHLRASALAHCSTSIGSKGFFRTSSRSVWPRRATMSLQS